jgi:hypothetical protein
MSNPVEIIATGGFNTGRMYTVHGQRIWWAYTTDSWTYFSDLCRGIDHWVAPSEGQNGPLSPHQLMKAYDNMQYAHRHDVPKPIMPKDFSDFIKFRI